MSNHLFPKAVERIYRIHKVQAHCDIPCGIYDPHDAQLGALTVIRMIQMMNELPKPSANASPAEVAAYEAKLSRFVRVKEDHAEQVKRELRILWGDYFKPDHVKQYPELHDLFWNALKTASKARQEVDMKAAQDLLSTVQKIAEIFWKTKGADVRRQPSLQTAGGELVYPVPKS
ncbi:MAG: superoxide dismutase, Ni [Thaumarchaeota archaeon]|nr:superoxide dismutase, Ni [Nitrososphaerota archaeon]